MAITYSRAEIIHMIESSSEDISNFYKQDFINYAGRTNDTKEFYTEVISKWCIDNIKLFDLIPVITRASSYKVNTHDGIEPSDVSNREEELLAMKLFRQREISSLGEIIDYQTPLKNVRSDNAGKIDLLSYDGKHLRLLELKRESSTETMLRCVLEGYTYSKTVDVDKLLKDFNLPLDTLVSSHPLVFLDSSQYGEMNNDNPFLIELIELLNSKPFYLVERNDIFGAIHF